MTPLADHFAKPDLVNEPTLPPSLNHAAYVRALYALSLFSNVTLKLSALLDSADPTLVAEAFAEHRARRADLASGGSLRRGSIASDTSFSRTPVAEGEEQEQKIGRAHV